MNATRTPYKAKDFTHEHMEGIKTLIKRGESYAAIGKRVGCSGYLIGKVVKQNREFFGGISAREIKNKEKRRKRQEFEDQVYFVARDTGMPHKELARLYDMSLNAIRSILHEARKRATEKGGLDA